MRDNPWHDTVAVQPLDLQCVWVRPTWFTASVLAYWHADTQTFEVAATSLSTPPFGDDRSPLSLYRQGFDGGRPSYRSTDPQVLVWWEPLNLEWRWFGHRIPSDDQGDWQLPGLQPLGVWSVDGSDGVPPDTSESTLSMLWWTIARWKAV